MADIFTSDFEGATPFSGWTTAAATVTQDTSIFHGGAAAAKFDNTTATDPVLTKTIAGSPTVLVGQWWLYVPAAMPGGLTGVTIGRVLCAGFNIYFKLNNTSSFQLQMQMDNGSTQVAQTASYAEDTWTRLTFRASLNPAPMTMEWNIGTTEQTAVQWGTGTTTSVTGYNLGFTGGLQANMIWYADDLRLSTTAADYDTYIGAAAVSPSSLGLLGIS